MLSVALIGNPFINILHQRFNPDKNYTLAEKIELLAMGLNFQIYQAKKIIDGEQNKKNEIDKFFNFCKEVTSIIKLMEIDIDFREIIIFEHHRSIINFLLEDKCLIDQEQFKRKNLNNFISFFCGYLAIGDDKEYFIKKILNENILENKQKLIDEKQLIYSIYFFDSMKESLTEKEIKTFADKYPKIDQFIKFIDQELLLKDQANIGREGINPAEIKDDNFSSLLKEKQLLIPFEKAIYFSLFQDNFCGYLQDLERRFESKNMGEDIFQFEDRSLIKFRNYIQIIAQNMSNVIDQEQLTTKNLSAPIDDKLTINSPKINPTINFLSKLREAKNLSHLH